MDATDYFSYTDKEIEAFKLIMRLKRGFRTIVSACTGDVQHLLALINKVCTWCTILHLAELSLKLSQSAYGLRSDDTAKLKSGILTLMHEDPKHGSAFASDYDIDILTTSDLKDLCRFQHMDTAAHLCPLQLKAHFEKDPL